MGMLTVCVDWKKKRKKVENFSTAKKRFVGVHRFSNHVGAVSAPFGTVLAYDFKLLVMIASRPGRFFFGGLW